MNLFKSIFILLFTFTVFLTSRCTTEKIKNPKKPIPIGINLDLPEIIKKGKLTVLAENSSTSYFMYKGKKMGFEYDILKLFAKDLGIKLEIKVVHNLDSLITMLRSGEGDIIACNYTITRERKKLINFSKPLFNQNKF